MAIINNKKLYTETDEQYLERMKGGLEATERMSKVMTFLFILFVVVAILTALRLN